ncbi:c-type cytochrome domain-containing protein [Parapedobacter koreensis]|nr:c-type cytochrome domain-containing protein [Parapedobacter koreensis]
MLLFLGRWHPLLVHLPIGMLILAFAFALLSRKTTYATLSSAVPATLLFGAVSAVLASISGYLLSLSGGYNSSALSLHQGLGISAALVSILCWLLYRKSLGESDVLSRLRRFRFALLTLLVVLLSVAGHYGGTLTHGEGYLTEALPERARLLLGWQPEQMVIENVQEAAIYTDIIQPIFNQRCQSCHGTRKQEGDLALHTLEALMRGGESGQVLVPGDAEASELYHRLILPEGDADRMPPKGRTPISTDQIQLIAWWINAGAPEDMQVKDIDQPETMQPILLALEGKVDIADIPPADPKIVEQLRAKNIKVVPLAAGKNQLAVNAINYPHFSAEEAQLLAGLGENVIQLRLSNTQITDNALQPIGQLAGLRHLYLDNTAIGNAGLAYLHACKTLQYLNLVNTKVTDEGLLILAKLPALQTVYLYQSEVTIHGIEQLVRERPELTIDTGNYALQALATDTIAY